MAPLVLKVILHLATKHLSKKKVKTKYITTEVWGGNVLYVDLVDMQGLLCWEGVPYFCLRICVAAENRGTNTEPTTEHSHSRVAPCPPPYLRSDRLFSYQMLQDE